MELVLSISLFLWKLGDEASIFRPENYVKSSKTYTKRAGVAKCSQPFSLGFHAETPNPIKPYTRKQNSYLDCLLSTEVQNPEPGGAVDVLSVVICISEHLINWPVKNLPIS